MSANSAAAILERVIEPMRDDLEPALARYILSLDFQAADLGRMNELAAKAREGSLSDEERREAEDYNRVSHLLAYLQSKARASLKRSGHAS